jgi:hypothetical protein
VNEGFHRHLKLNNDYQRVNVLGVGVSVLNQTTELEVIGVR